MTGQCGWHLAESSLGHLSSCDGVAKQVPGVSDTIGLSDFLMIGLSRVGKSIPGAPREGRWQQPSPAMGMALQDLRCRIDTWCWAVGAKSSTPRCLVGRGFGVDISSSLYRHLHSVKTLSLGRLDAWSVVI